MSDFNCHIDHENQQIIAERDGVVIGVMPWIVDGTQVTFGIPERPVCVAPHERRKGVGSAMTTLARQQFPREEGYVVSTTSHMSEIMRNILDRPSVETRRNEWFDTVHDGEATPVATGTVQQILAEVQEDFDRLIEGGE